MLFFFFLEIPFLNANSVDPDQTPQNAASDQGLHCLLMFLLWGTRHRLVTSAKSKEMYILIQIIKTLN